MYGYGCKDLAKIISLSNNGVIKPKLCDIMGKTEKKLLIKRALSFFAHKTQTNTFFLPQILHCLDHSSCS